MRPVQLQPKCVAAAGDVLLSYSVGAPRLQLRCVLSTIREGSELQPARSPVNSRAVPQKQFNGSLDTACLQRR